MKAFWWLKEGAIAGMARPGFNFVHWKELPFDEAVLFGWLGLHSSGPEPLKDFRAHVASYAPRIFKYHGHDEASGRKAIEVFADNRGVAEVMERLTERTRAVDNFRIDGDNLQFKLSKERLSQEIEFLNSHKIGTVVTLTEKHHWRDELGEHFDVHHFSIPDLGAPKIEQVEGLAKILREARENKTGVVVHCLAGIGRTSTMLASAHIMLGDTSESIIDLLRARNPWFTLTGEQAEFVRLVSERKSQIR